MRIAEPRPHDKPAGTLIDIATLPAQPWKNGGGTTTQIAIDPPEASLDTFAWRISSARIDSDGPFSVFSGITRWIMLLEGNGFVLEFPGGRSLTVTKPFVPHRFDGGLRIRCRLIDGPCTDLNVMARRDLSLNVSVTTATADAPPEGHALRQASGAQIRLSVGRLLRVLVAGEA